MPETIDSQRTAHAIAQAAFFHGSLETQSWPDQPDQQVSSPGYQPQQEALAQRKWVRIILTPKFIFSGGIHDCVLAIPPFHE